MRRLSAFLARLQKPALDEAGQGLAELGLILSLVAIVCLVTLTILGQSISTSAGFVALPAAL